MGFRFQRSLGIARGLKLNFSKSGVSLSVGKKGFTTNLGRQGVRTTVGLPGSGMSYRTGSLTRGRRGSAWIWVVVLVVICLLWAYA